MKIKLIPIIAVIVILVCGCELLDRGYDKVTIPASTNAVTGVVTPERTELVDKPVVTGTIEAVKSAPIPYASIAGSLAGMAVALYRNFRNKKALIAVVQGIDEARGILQTPELKPIDDKVKDFLIKNQELAGVLNHVSSVVNKYTGDTVPPVK